MAEAERKSNEAAGREESLKPTGHVKDPEPITEEERFMFRKLIKFENEGVFTPW